MARAARLSSRLDVVLFVGCLIFSLVALVLPGQMREPLAETLRRTLVAPLVGLQSGAERWRTAWQLSDERTARLDSAVMRSFNVVALQTENDHLRKLLGLGARLHTGFIPAEAVHNAVPGDVVTTLTLTAGSSVGVRVYSPVVSPEGLVGIVQTVDPKTSSAILFSNPDFRASAMSGDGTAFGIVYPHLEQRLGGGSGYLLELRGVPFRTTLQHGTMIYTSGLGGTFPRGIPIGWVLSEMKTPEGWTRTYLLQPSVTPSKITSVMVLTPSREAARVDNVWQIVAMTDSATRSVVIAGDSVLRQTALDSIRRAAAAQAPPRSDSVAPRPDTTARPAGVGPARTDTARPVRRPTPRPVVRDTGTRTTRPATDTGARVPAAPARPRPDTARPDTTPRRDTLAQPHR